MVRRFVPLLVGLALAVALTEVWRQVGHPFIEHDDWDFQFPIDSLRREFMLDRLLAEGRWLNYLWWLGPGHLLSPVTAVLIYELSFVVLVARVAWRWGQGWLSLPTAVALFGCPMVVALSFWPATVGLSVLITAVAACTLARCTVSRRALLTWIVVATGLAFLSYPPAALVIFVILIVEVVDRDLREIVLVTVAFGITYVASTLVVFTLNLIAFGTFGIEIRPWRHPNPVHGLGDLGENLGRYGDQLGQLAQTITIPLALGGLATAACLLIPRLRARGIRLVLTTVVLLGLQSSTTILSGVTTPFRGTAWIWFLIIVPTLWLAQEVRARQWIRAGAVVALVAVGLWGLRYGHDAIETNQHRREVYQRIEDRLMSLARTHPDARVLIYGNEADWLNAVFTQEAEYLAQKVYNDHGVLITYCRPPTCAAALRPSVIARADAGQRALLSAELILVVPSAHRR
jgi:hypothetical protein